MCRSLNTDFLYTKLQLRFNNIQINFQFILRYSIKYYFGEQTKENEIEWACGTHEEEERRLRSCGVVTGKN